MLDYNKIIDHYYKEEENKELRNILIVHSQMVRDLALRCCDAHPELHLDRDLVEAASMLHDIGIIRTDADGIHCFGTEHYLRHGRIGALMLREDANIFGYTEEEIEPYARICERHTGAGLTRQQIEERDLPLPHQDFLPETMEEKLVCYADKFYSKTHLEYFKPYEKVVRSLEKFGEDGVKRFEQWHRLFCEKS